MEHQWKRKIRWLLSLSLWASRLSSQHLSLKFLLVKLNDSCFVKINMKLLSFSKIIKKKKIKYPFLKLRENKKFWVRFNHLNPWIYCVSFIPIVQKQKKGKNKTALGKRKQDEPSSSQSLSTGNESNKVKWLISRQNASTQVFPLLNSLGRFSTLSI